MTNAGYPDNPTKIYFKWLLALLLMMAVAVILTACSPKVIETIHTEYRDTTIYKELIRDSIVQVPIPLGRNQAIVNTADTSHLETSVAVSNAYVTPDGLLHHDLSNRHDATLPAIVPIYYHFTQSITSSESAQIMTRTVEVEKPLTKMQSFKLRAFWWLVGLLGLSGLWTFRKPLLKLIKR